MKHLYFYLFFSLLLCFSCGDSSDDSGSDEKSYLNISTNQKLIANASGSFDIYVNSNTSWKIEAKNTWLKPERKEGNGSISVKINYDKNETSKRTGIVTFTRDGGSAVELTVTQSELTFKNPIGDIPDPWIIKQGGYYYLCKAQGNGINIAKSDRLTSFPQTQSVWRCPTDNGNNKPWNVTNVWAPELHYIDGRWYIYYAAGRPHSETDSYKYQRSGVLRAKTDNPMGEWEDMGMLYTGDGYTNEIVPNQDNTEYAIDLGVFQLNNKLYAVWSGYTSATNSEQKLYIAKMSNPYTISSSRTAISQADKSWELISSSTKINEGPAFLKNKEKNKFFVVYSCNGSWTKNYRLGYIMLNDTLKDPTVKANWTKSSLDIFYRCDDTSSVDGVNGVGHCCFTKSPDDSEDWIVYHVKKRNDSGWGSGRSMFMQSFGWKADGTPDLGAPVGWGESIAAPSGESR